MAENRIPLTIAGLSLVVTTGEDEEYVRGIAEEIDADINGILERNPSASVTSAGLLCALDYLDGSKKATKNANSLRSQIKDYLADAANAKLMFDEERKRSNELDVELQALRSHLTRLASEADTSGVVDRLKNELSSSAGELARLRKQTADALAQNKALAEKAGAMSDYISGQDREIERLQMQAADQSAKLAAANEHIERLSRGDGTARELSAENERLKAENAELKKQLDTLTDAIRSGMLVSVDELPAAQPEPQAVAQPEPQAVAQPEPQAAAQPEPAESEPAPAEPAPAEPAPAEPAHRPASWWDAPKAAPAASEPAPAEPTPAEPAAETVEDIATDAPASDDLPGQTSFFDSSLPEEAPAEDAAEEGRKPLAFAEDTRPFEAPVDEADAPALADPAPEAPLSSDDDPFSDLAIEDGDLTLGFEGSASSMDVPLEDITRAGARRTAEVPQDTAPQNDLAAADPDYVFEDNIMDILDSRPALTEADVPALMQGATREATPAAEDAAPTLAPVEIVPAPSEVFSGLEPAEAPAPQAEDKPAGFFGGLFGRRRDKKDDVPADELIFDDESPDLLLRGPVDLEDIIENLDDEDDMPNLSWIEDIE